jgi:hypothetical protein
MSIKVKCPNGACGKVSVVKDEHAGKRAKCPGCGTPMTIPNGSGAPPASAIKTPSAAPKAAPARRPAPPPMAEPEGAGEDQWNPPPAAKSGMVTAIAIVNFVLGGLSLACGLFALLVGGVLTGMGSSTPKITIKGNVDPEFAAKFADEFNKASGSVGGSLALVGTLIMITSLLTIAWGAAAIPSGIGLLKRRNWGRLLSLGLAAAAGLMGLLSLVMVFMGAPAINAIINLLLYGAYAGWVFFFLMKPAIRAEFS